MDHDHAAHSNSVVAIGFELGDISCSDAYKLSVLGMG